MLFLALATGCAVASSAGLAGESLRDEIAVVVNEADPLSRAVAAYYVRRRGIRPDHVISIRLDPSRNVLSRAEFDSVRRELLRRTPSEAQFYALTWIRPFRVECMSMTSAVTFGFDRTWCASGCRRTRLSPYFGSDSRRPWTDLGIRPTMSIAAVSLQRARELIDRGVASDGLRPRGTAYLVRSGDDLRDVRAPGYDDARLLAGNRVSVSVVSAPAIEHRSDVMFYFTGASVVQAIESNRYLPGAIADHLTSLGGVLTGSEQMSALRWLEAGATGSYGTVVEPCNFAGKFPSPGILMDRYLGGETLIEAYWKSVAMPGQGIFVGEPLARPFGAKDAK
jgi:uncharacterized protein (TIGR03790 family)